MKKVKFGVIISFVVFLQLEPFEIKTVKFVP